MEVDQNLVLNEYESVKHLREDGGVQVSFRHEASSITNQPLSQLATRNCIRNSLVAFCFFTNISGDG